MVGAGVGSGCAAYGLSGDHREHLVKFGLICLTIPIVGTSIMEFAFHEHIYLAALEAIIAGVFVGLFINHFGGEDRTKSTR